MSLRLMARRFTSVEMATATTVHSLSVHSVVEGLRYYTTKDDLYEKAKIKCFYPNHPDCRKWDKSNAMSNPEHMKLHKKVVHDYKGTNSCNIRGNCIEDNLTCASFCPHLYFPRTWKRNNVEVKGNVEGKGGKWGKRGKGGKGGK